MNTIVEIALSLLQRFIIKFSKPLMAFIAAILTGIIAHRAGRKSIETHQGLQNTKTLRAMAKAEATKPETREELLDRLNKGDV